MDIRKILVELVAERDRIYEAILVLERLKTGNGRRRGRPPRWKTAAGGSEPASPVPSGAPN